MPRTLIFPLLCLLATGACHSGGNPPEPESAQSPPETEGRPAAAVTSRPAISIDIGLRGDTLQFRQGDSLDHLLRRAGMPAEERWELATALKPVFDLGQFRAGSLLHLLRDDEGRTLGLHHPLDFERDLCAWRTRSGLSAALLSADLDWRTRLVTAELERSFYESFTEQGEDGNLATRVADLFAGEIDFFFDLRPGDRMELLIESSARPDRTERRDRVLAARMLVDGESSEAFLFPARDGRRRYFHRDGASLERQFLRAPLNFSRISSGFSSRRLHPILGIHRPHYGVDYAAPVGTAVVATADGSVFSRQRDGSAGRYIKIRHAGGIETIYMHLSRWAKGTAPGQRVEKGQVIGYVGSSGLSTGPHLDYRIKVGGRYVNPRRFRSDPAAPLPAEEKGSFRLQLERYDRLWAELCPVEAEEVARQLSLSAMSKISEP